MVLTVHGLYLEVYIFCILCILLVIQKTIRNRETFANRSLFIKLLIVTLLFCVSESAWVFIEGNVNAIALNYVSNMLYFTIVIALCFYWFLYSEDVLGTDWRKRGIWTVISLIPLLVCLGLCFSTYHTQLLFYIDEKGYYCRGKLYWIYMVLSFSYIAYAGARSIYHAKHDYVDRRKHISFASFFVAPAIGCIVQSITRRPYFCIGIVIGVLNVFLNMQQRQISTDPLTNSNNRNRLLQYLADKVQNYNKNSQVVLLFMDIEGLRYINDIFGYSKGDQAILSVVDVLRQIAARKGYFVCRYGGDELALVCESAEPIDMKLLIESIQNEVDASLSQEQFSVKLSSGYAILERGMSVQKFVYKAYEDMREKKE